MFQSETWVPAGHYYSPLVDPGDPRVQAVVAAAKNAPWGTDESLAIDDDLVLANFAAIQAAYAKLPFPDTKSPDFRYFYENPAFSFGDGVTYFGMLMSRRPRRVIEVGSGYSSCLLMDVNDQFFEGQIEVTFIDPHPETLLALLSPDDGYRKRIRAEPVQDVDTPFFRQLERGDFLFIDSSHVLKTGSDVNDYLFRILPALQAGALIHIHDIFYPFEYEENWVQSENRSWNEAYAIRAFLQYNTKFRVAYFYDYMLRKHPARLAETPLVHRNRGGSLWLEKV